MRQHLNRYYHADQLTPEWQRPSGANAPLNTQQKVRRTQQHRP